MRFGGAMKRITDNPYLVFPLGAVVGMALLVGVSLLQSDRLIFNDAFPVFFLLLPLLAALFSFVGRVPAGESKSLWDRRVVKWLGTTVLALAGSFAIWFSSGFIPYDGGPAYNYPRFHYVYYPQAAARQRVSAGGKALDETLYTLEGNKVALSELWKGRPIVVEFGSIT